MTADFPKATVERLAKRAGYHCSNPACFALTSGPADTERQYSLVGEAAHIYGARDSAARFDSQMTDLSRAQEANGIWLCRNCHKIIDDDENSYPAELLFQWKQAHLTKITEHLGKSAADLREKANERILRGFENCSSLARQIILDKPKYWEYNLTAELLSTLTKSTRYRYNALKRGFYALPLQKIDRTDFIAWTSVHMSNVTNQVEAMKSATMGALVPSWGPDGHPGSEHEILRACELISETCERLLELEQQARFARPPQNFRKVLDLLVGIAGAQLEEMFKMPDWILEKTSTENLQGEHILNLVFSVPDTWSVDLEREVFAAIRAEKSGN